MKDIILYTLSAFAIADLIACIYFAIKFPRATARFSCAIRSGHDEDSYFFDNDYCGFDDNDDDNN